MKYEGFQREAMDFKIITLNFLTLAAKYTEDE